jgi:hypothetical protein
MPNLAFLPWLVGLLLCIPMLFFVLYPLYQPRRRMATLSSIELGKEGQAGLPSQVDGEQAARAALIEVEMDYQLGNLAEPDYRSLRARYLRRAYQAHKSIQAHEQQLDELIEERLRQLREEEETEEAESHEDNGNHES